MNRHEWIRPVFILIALSLFPQSARAQLITCGNDAAANGTVAGKAGTAIYLLNCTTGSNPQGYIVNSASLELGATVAGSIEAAVYNSSISARLCTVAAGQVAVSGLNTVPLTGQGCNDPGNGANNGLGLAPNTTYKVALAYSNPLDLRLTTAGTTCTIGALGSQFLQFPGYNANPALTFPPNSTGNQPWATKCAFRFYLSLTTVGGTSATANLAAISLNPTSVQGGANSTGTATLDNPAPANGAVVALTSSNTSAATIPGGSVTIPAGSTTATFTVTTSTVSADTTSTITGTYNGVSKQASLTVTGAAVVANLAAISLNPTSVQGGANSTGTATLDNPAPANGAVVALTSSNTNAATIPGGTVTIPAGSTTATFTVTTSAVSTDTTSTITGTYNGVSKQASLTVTAAAAGSPFSQGWTQLGADATNSLINSGECPTSLYNQGITGPEYWMGTGGCISVVGAWSGGVLRASTNQLILWGGGHANYGGNEVYAVDINNPARYHRIFGPTTPGVAVCSAGTNCAYPACRSLPMSGSGNSCSACSGPSCAPNSRETYGGMAYIPANGDASGSNPEEMLIDGGSLASQGGTPGADFWIFDFSTVSTPPNSLNGWTRIPQSNLTGIGSDNLDNVAAWDPSSKAIYLLNYGSFGVFNPSSTSLTLPSGTLAPLTYRRLSSPAAFTTNYGTIDESTHLFVNIHAYCLNNSCGTTKDYTTVVDEFDLATGKQTSYCTNDVTHAVSANYCSTLGVATGCPSSIGQYAGATYDTSLGKVVFLYPENDNGIYIWDHATHSCTRETYGGSTPTVGVAHGIMGRFRYVPGKNYYIYLSGADRTPWVLCRAPGGCGP